MPLKDEQARKEYQKEYYKEWYQKNKKSRYPELKARVQRNLEWFKTYRKQQKCCRCGFSDYRALEFHHKTPVNDSDPKLRINYIVTHRGWSLKRIKEFIESDMEIMCANCHKIHHWEENGYD